MLERHTPPLPDPSNSPLSSQASSQHISQKISPYQDRRNALLCGFLVAAAVLLSFPFAELGRNDDWSYARSALDLTRTGRLIYNGWSTAILGAQAYYGAGIIKLFGFSFTALRLGVLPFTCCTTAMLYCLARRVGASAAISTLAALTLGLSQLVIECAATYSTDLPAFFCCIFTLHQIARSLDVSRRSPRQILVPLFLAAAAGYAGGSIRQVYWLMPCMALPYAAWVRRRDPACLIATLALLAAVAIGAFATEEWAHAQPYFVPEYFHAMQVVFVSEFPRSLEPAIGLVMTVTLFALPMIVGVWSSLEQPESALVQVVGVLFAVAALFWLGDAALAPWLGNLVTSYGVFNLGQDAIGEQPQVIPDQVRLVLTLICSAAAARMLWRMIRSTPALLPKIAAGALPHPLWMTGLFAVPYILLILFRAPAFTLVDRYTLPLTSILCLWLAWLSARCGSRRVTFAGWSLLVIVALFGIAVTHDEFATARARLRAAAALNGMGIPRTSITAGVDFDAWTQVAQAGYVNESRIWNPSNAFVPHPRAIPPGRTDYWFWEWSPTVRPDYFVVDSPRSDLDNMPGMAFPYGAWLPPFSREVYVQKRPVGWLLGW